MQSAVPNGVGGMLAVTNSNFETINNILVIIKAILNAILQMIIQIAKLL